MVRVGVLVAMSTGMYILETFVPFPLPVGRWGFSNLPMLLALYTLQLRHAVVVAVFKAFLGSMMVGSFLSVGFFMSMIGGLGAVLSMKCVLSLLKSRVGILGISLLGAFINNTLQIAVAALAVHSKAPFFYYPYLVIMGSFSAAVNAYITSRFLNLGFFVYEEGAKDGKILAGFHDGGR